MFPDYDCETCNARLKIERGCEQDSPFPRWSDQSGTPRSRCPRRSIYEEPERYLYAFRAYSLYKDGFLPEAGGMNDQAALFPEIMLVIKSAHAFVDNYEEEAERKKQANFIPQSGKR